DEDTIIGIGLEVAEVHCHPHLAQDVPAPRAAANDSGSTFLAQLGRPVSPRQLSVARVGSRLAQCVQLRHRAVLLVSAAVHLSQALEDNALDGACAWWLVVAIVIVAW